MLFFSHALPQALSKARMKQPGEREQASGPDADMTQVMESSDADFKVITMICMLRAPMEKVESMQEHVNNVSRERKILGED